MWNALYGTRGGVPYGGACLPKDTEAFLSFVREQGMEHRMLEATIGVNQQLAAHVPAAASPDKIDMILETARLHDETPSEEPELVLEVGGKAPIVVRR
jgi:UDPglucose 6-dehydrogenase